MTEERGVASPTMPPPVLDTDFQAVDTTVTDNIRAHFRPFIEGLHGYLNGTSCLRDLQDFRRHWKRGLREPRPFGESSFVAQPQHWFTRNVGGRNEAQFNVGMFPGYLRVGLGFEFTPRAHGVPADVQAVYGRFTNVLRQDRRTFEQFVHADGLMLEWVARGTNDIKYTKTQDVLRRLLRPPNVPDWIFVGRLLDRRNDAQILEDPAHLGAVMESVFRGLLPPGDKPSSKQQGTIGRLFGRSPGLRRVEGPTITA